MTLHKIRRATSGASAGGGGPVAFSFEANNIVTGAANPHTHSGVAIGTATSDRIVVVLVSHRPGGSAGTVASATIAGFSASIITQDSHASTKAGCAIIACSLPTATYSGSTGDVVLNGSGNFDATGISVLKMTGASGVTANDIATPTENAGDPGTIALDIPANGGGVVCTVQASNGNTATIVGLDTEDYDVDVGAVHAHHGHGVFGTTQTGLGVGWDYTSAPGNTCTIACSWSPAA